MPHHEDCYQENGGCTVFGCPQAPADDPKLQVSYSDLQMTRSAPGIQAAVTTPLPVVPSRYAGPLGLSTPVAPTPAQQVAAAGSSGAALAPATAASPALAYTPVRYAKSRTTYILLGVFLGAVGAHNFYAGYTGRAVGQLCLSVLTLFYLAIIAWVWAIVEICIVDKDSAGIEFS